MRACRKCGCTENDPCFVDNAGQSHTVEGLAEYSDEQLEAMTLVPCHWIEIDLCSGCVVDKAAPLLYGPHGEPLRGAP